MSTRRTPPRDDLIRAMRPAEMRAASDTDGALGDLFGYFAVFDEWTVIDSWEGRFKERIARGAFAKTIREQRGSIQTLFDHGFDPQIGNKPLGVDRELYEDETGAFAVVPLIDTTYNRDIAALLRGGALRGQSFRFAVVKDEWTWPKDDDDEALPERTIREMRLFEKGPVTFPAYAAATAGIRSAADFRSWRARNLADTDSRDPVAGSSTPGTPGTEPQQGAARSTTDEPAGIGHSAAQILRDRMRARATELEAAARTDQ